jgi:hypothetical protein
MALYPYNNTLNSLQSFQVFTSYFNASPNFVILLDTNNDGLTDDVLISDYLPISNGNWQATQGGNRTGWSETYLELGNYGNSWNDLGYWKNQYGNATVLFVGVGLNYWTAYDNSGFDQPLYADEVIINNVTYNVISASDFAPANQSGSATIPLGENIQLNTQGSGMASMTNENVHTSAFSAELELPGNSIHNSFAMALYPYNGSLNTLSSFSIWSSFTLAVPRFVISLDTNNDGLPDLYLLSDYQFVSNGSWQLSTGGNIWGWTVANPLLISYGTTWNSLDFWKGQYGTATVLSVGICLEYWAVYDRGGCGFPLYADGMIVNGVSYNISGPPPTPSPSPTPIPNPTSAPAISQSSDPTKQITPQTQYSIPILAAPNPQTMFSPNQNPAISQPQATSAPARSKPIRELAVQPESNSYNTIGSGITVLAILIVILISLLTLTIYKKRTS